MVKRFLFYLLIIPSIFVFGQGQAIAYDLADIGTPLESEILDFEPVEVVVSFQEGADPSTFAAWLNGQNITDRFAATKNGMKAQLTPADGLRTFDEGEKGSVKGKGRNFLNTYVGGEGYEEDYDRVKFYVETGTVETTRDDKGVWFITGSDDVSLYYIFEGMGYAVATDRLWQMELYRRQGRGTLAEILGPSQLPTDIFIRTIAYSEEELAKGFQNMDADAQKVVKGYVAGINRRIGEIRDDPGQLPFEFAALGGLMPADWNNGDVLAWIAMLLRNFDPEALDTGQMDNAALYQDLVDIGNKTPAITQLAAIFFQVPNIALDRWSKKIAQASGGVDIGLWFDLQIFLDKGVFHQLVHTKLMHPVTGTINQRGTGTIKNIHGSHLFPARQQKITPLKYGNDSTDGQIHIHE